MRRRLALALLFLLPALTAEAGGTVDYGPLPDALAQVELRAGDSALAARGLALLRTGNDRSQGHALLVMLGDGGLRAAATRLVEGTADPDERHALLRVVAAARHPAADTILARAATELRPLYRMLAAHGLGVGRTPGAVDVLRTLVRDPVPGVRIAALRSLFAIPGDEARAARLAVPVDDVPVLHARRLQWHRRARDANDALLELARAAYARGRSAEERTSAAHLLTLPALKTPTALLERVMRETGGGPVVAWLVRLASGAPQRGYDDAQQRSIAIEAMFNLLAREDASEEQRARWLRWAVAWVARPVAMDPYRKDPIPEYELRRRLPDQGAALVAPVTELLERGAFDDPRKGMMLLRELGPDLALPTLHRFLAPRTQHPAFESHAETSRRRFLRGAAAGVVQEIGRVGDAALARALIWGPDSTNLKVDIVRALEGDDGAWAVPLLIELMNDESLELQTDAILVLERRSEPEAHAALTEYMFAHPGQAPHRLPHLVRRGDEKALKVVKRALGDKRSFIRKSALGQFNRRRNPRLCRTGKDLVLAHKPALSSAQEVQDTIYALLGVAPEQAVAWVDAHWEQFPNDRMRKNSLELLHDATGKAAREAAIDLALRRVPPDAPLPLTLASAAVFEGPYGGYAWDYKVEDVGARLRAWLDSESVALQREAIKAWSHPQAPVAVERLLALLDRARAGEALPGQDSTHVGEQEFASEVIQALVHQPWEKIEGHFLDMALSESEDTDLSAIAAYRLIGNVSEAGRERIARWINLDAEPNEGAPGRRADRNLQLYLAAAVGTGADEARAKQLHAVLQRELWAFFTPQWLERVRREGPGVLSDREVTDAAAEADERRRAYDFYTRVSAVARAVASTKHEASVLATLELVFDPRLAVFAQECGRRQAWLVRRAGADAAAIRPSSLNALGHKESRDNWGMPWAVYEILREAKVVDDEQLARAFERVLGAARADGRLARFPLLYLIRTLESQLEPHSGRKPACADVIARYAALHGATDRAEQYWLYNKLVSKWAEERRFDEAAAAQRVLVRTLIRGNHTQRYPAFHERAMGLLRTLEGGAAAARGDSAAATTLFAAARRHGPHNPDLLNTVAWYRALANFELDKAEAEVTHANMLEARVEIRPNINAADTLAYILLLRERPGEGLRLLAPRMLEKDAVTNGLVYYHLAQLHVALGRFASGRNALVEALTWDRALLADAAADPHLAALFKKLPLAKIAALAETNRFENQVH